MVLADFLGQPFAIEAFPIHIAKLWFPDMSYVSGITNYRDYSQCGYTEIPMVKGELLERIAANAYWNTFVSTSETQLESKTNSSCQDDKQPHCRAAVWSDHF